MRINRVHMAQQVSRFEANSGDRGCHTYSKRLQSVRRINISYQDDAGRLFKGSPHSCSTAVAGIHWNEVAQRNHWDYFIYRAVLPFSAIRKQAAFFPTSLLEQNRNSEWHSAQAMTGLANEQAKDLMVGVTSCESWIKCNPVRIHFQSNSRGGLDAMRIWCASDFKWIYVNATNWIGYTFDAHCGVHVNRP